MEVAITTLAVLVLALGAAVVWLMVRRRNGREFSPVIDEVELREYDDQDDLTTPQ